MIPWLDPKQLWFPDPQKALNEPPGLLAAGGDLSPERLLKAYSMGIFPWFEKGQPILWWSPDPRAVLYPHDFKLRKSLRKRLRSRSPTLSFDADFRGVIRACGQPRSYGEGTWITPEMERAYLALHELGYAHSVEIWRENTLVGGLYGVALGRVFFGESMFSREPDASKIALCGLAYQLDLAGFRLLDCQMRTTHLDFMGSRTVSRQEFLDHLENDARGPSPIENWSEIQLNVKTLAAWQPGDGGNPKLQ
jgi:leucyl/phenylalanyl-tRNA--protein transferase